MPRSGRAPSHAAVFVGFVSVSRSLGDPALSVKPQMDQSAVCERERAQLGHQSSPLRVAEDVAAAASDWQRAVQRPGTRRERPPGDARAQLGSSALPAPVGRRRAGPRGHRKWTREPQRHWRHTAANNDHHRPKFGRGTSKVSDNFLIILKFVLNV